MTYLGEDITIFADIRNDGGAEAENVTIRFFDGPAEPGNQIGVDQTIAFIGAQSGYATAAVTHHWFSPGDKIITVQVDPDFEIIENDKSDNLATRGLIGPLSDFFNCSNGIKDYNEDDIDCGGICAPCANCSDGIKNQDEALIDCGGTCGICTAKQFLISVNTSQGEVGVFLEPGFGYTIETLSELWLNGTLTQELFDFPHAVEEIFSIRMEHC